MMQHNTMYHIYSSYFDINYVYIMDIWQYMINNHAIGNLNPPSESLERQEFISDNFKFREGHKFAKFRCTRNLVF